MTPAPRTGRPGPTRPAQAITAELVAAALASIPPDIGHDDRVRLGFAVFDALGDGGRELWLEWAGQRGKPDAAEDRATWKSVRKPGKVTAGTLFGLAKDHGFKFPRGRAPAAPATSTAEQLERRRRRQAELEAEYRAKADGTAIAARRMWDGAIAAGSSPYLERKRVQAFGVRFLADGTLLVPMRNAAGELMNLQRIDGAGQKRFLAGGRKSSLWHQLGDVEGAPAILLAEGYATGATLHEATGRPVAVCFDAGNLEHVARELRAAYPKALLLVCGDDDRDTATRIGKNPGRLAAAAAARAAAVNGEQLAGAVFPEALPAGGSDFNDLAAHAGLEAVRDQVARAVQAPAVPKPRRTAKSPAGGAIVGADVSAQGATAAGGAGGPPGGDDDHDAMPPAAPKPEPDRFGYLVDELGVWFVGKDRDGDKRKPLWLCAPLHVTARTRSDDANGWGFLLEWYDLDGHAKQWAMPSALLAGDGAEWAARLRDMGLEMSVAGGARQHVAMYINTRKPEERATCVDKVGWHGPVYVLPSGTIGQCEGRRYVYQSETGTDDLFRRSGELGDWQREVAARCAGNSRLVFAVAFAFAAMVLPFSGQDGGGIHIKGASRGGKTTALRCAASVFGRPAYVQQWRTTANALENTAVQANHALLVLDELGQLEPAEGASVAYLLANGMDKGRSTRGLVPRRRRTWQLLFLSSGEVGLADLAIEAGKRVHVGQEVRMADLPLDAGAGLGGLEELHGADSAAEFAEALLAATARCYGTGGRAWLEWCAEHLAALPGQLRDLIDRYCGEFVPDAASSQVRTVGRRFALAAAAGELATSAGVTGWAEGEAAGACRRCFEAWLGARGHLDNGEEVAALRQVQAWIEKNGDALLTWTHRAMDDHRPGTPMRAGFKRLVDEQGKPLRPNAASDYLDRRSAAESSSRAEALVEYLILPQAFKRDVCRGMDAEFAAQSLRRHGHLVHEAERLTRNERLPGLGTARCYRIRPSILGAEARAL